LEGRAARDRERILAILGMPRIDINGRACVPNRGVRADDQINATGLRYRVHAKEAYKCRCQGKPFNEKQGELRT
jgi:hypothetical protein